MLVKIAAAIVVCIVFCCKNRNAECGNNRSDAAYTHLRYAFYKDASGTVYEKKIGARDEIDEPGKMFYDSTMFYPDYPERIALKKMVDINTYTEFEETPFSKDRNHVYYVRATSDGAYRFVVAGAHPDRFTPVRFRWGKDDRNVFWENRMVEGADAASFHVDEENGDSAFDRNSGYVNGERSR